MQSSMILMATYVCVGCGYSEHIPSEGALRPCPRCEYTLHKCNCFPCVICDRVMMVLEACEKGETKEQVVADLAKEFTEYKQPPFSDEEITAIWRYPSLADWEAFAYPGILAPDKEEPELTSAHFAKFPVEEVL